MDAQAASGCVEESLSCSICHEMFTDPVILKCGHNFCRECVCDFWKQKTSLSCPFCRASSSNTDLIRNHTIRDVVEAVKREEKKPVIQSKYLCSQHGEKRKLYCSEDHETICFICETSKKHKAHPCCPVEEAAMEFKNLQDIKTRAACTYKEPEIPSEALIDVVKYLGNIQHRVWNNSIIHPVTVTLDPNTAHPNLMLSEDLTAVSWGWTRREDLPDNPERFDMCPGVLGSEGFTSGRHSWVVDVENQTSCFLGVAAESANRKGNIYLNLKPELGYWIVELYTGDHAAFTEEGLTQLEVLKTPKKVLVCVDYEAGKVSFSNADDMSHIYTFTHKFKHKIFPFFCLCTVDAPLRIYNL
ncbi:zinc-binding protein A33-like [Latimeria chalumnae]|uniref:zinc-binding protein A33-like n=1 Tax=Latimeria chalumnae TaxID=7897 RepID=UPI00313D943B